jgi:nonsense-mediated mRNA decay protein 3
MDFEAHVNRGGAVPDVILVRKSYEEKRKKTRGRAGRAWKLKHLAIEAGEDRCVCRQQASSTSVASAS